MFQKQLKLFAFYDEYSKKYYNKCVCPNNGKQVSVSSLSYLTQQYYILKIATILPKHNVNVIRRHCVKQGQNVVVFCISTMHWFFSTLYLMCFTYKAS